MLLLLEAQEDNWDEIDLMVRAFQRTTHGAALCGRAGGGRAGRPDARRRLRDRAARRPRAGGGRDLHRARRGRRRTDSGRRRHEGDAGARGRADCRAGSATLLPPCSARSRRSASRKVSTSAAGRAAARLPAPVDAITMNRERLIADAKALRAAARRARAISRRRRARRFRWAATRCWRR